MIQIRKIVKDILKAVHPRVYFQTAPEKAVMPYLVYDLLIVDDGEGDQLITLEVDGWDMTEDTTPLETLMANANEALNKKPVTTDTMAVTFYLDRKIPLIDDDKRIKRRKYIYEGHGRS